VQVRFPGVLAPEQDGKGSPQGIHQQIATNKTPTGKLCLMKLLQLSKTPSK